MIDLQPFCSTDSYRPEVLRPFSAGEYTYATNGHIIVRVPRRDDVPERPKAPDVARLFIVAPQVSWRALRKVELPDAIKVPCDSCEGRGTEHDCPDCTCICTECDGSGAIVGRGSISVGDALFDIKYVRLLAALPGIMVPETVPPDSASTPMPFRFDGGDGLLLGLRRKYATHVETPA